MFNKQLSHKSDDPIKYGTLEMTKNNTWIADLLNASTKVFTDKVKIDYIYDL